MRHSGVGRDQTGHSHACHVPVPRVHQGAVRAGGVVVFVHPSRVPGVQTVGADGSSAPAPAPRGKFPTLDLASLPDRALAAAAAVGDRDAFDEIVRRFAPSMTRFAESMLGDHGAAEEVVQDSFVAAWKAIAGYRHESALRTWLFGITSHKSLDHRRRRIPRPATDHVVDGACTDPHTDPSSTCSGAAFLLAVDAVLATMPPRQRACWVLREVDGMRIVDIAEIGRAHV